MTSRRRMNAELNHSSRSAVGGGCQYCDNNAHTTVRCKALASTAAGVAMVVSSPVRHGAWIAIACLLACGCQRSGDAQYASSADVQALEEPLQAVVHKELAARCGTPQRPKLLGSDGKDFAHLERGERVYQHYCVGCHGVSGGGDGVAADYLTPRPRDYRRGIFKFTSTGYGNRPRRRGFAADRDEWHHRHVDAVVSPAAEARSRRRGRLCAGADASRRAGADDGGPGRQSKGN